MKKFKPTSAGRRQMSVVTYRGVLTRSKPHKALTTGFRRGSSRNAFGRITMRHKGGGVKRSYREIDFRYEKKDIGARVVSIEYDPNRSGFIGLVLYRDGEKRYTLLPKSVGAGDSFIVSDNAPIKPANRLKLGNIPVGTFVYNIEAKPGGGAKFVRSAGDYAEVIAHDGDYTLLKMPSTEVRKVHRAGFASVGSVSNEEHWLTNIGKAGRSRWLGIRPTVRGSVMNPVDHPRGGGEGKQGRGRRREINIYGKPTGKGQKTRRPKKYSNILVVSRRKVGKK